MELIKSIKERRSINYFEPVVSAPSFCTSRKMPFSSLSPLGRELE